MKKIIKYHLNIHKKYMLDQNLEGVPQKVRLPRPSEVQNWKGRGRRNFWARALKFCTDTYFLKIFKWYLHHFLISVTVCHLPKSWKAYYSRCCVFHDQSNYFWTIGKYCQSRCSVITISFKLFFIKVRSQLQNLTHHFWESQLFSVNLWDLLLL